MWLQQRRSPGAPHRPSPWLSLTALFPYLPPVPETPSRTCKPLAAEKTTHPSCRRHGPGAKREEAQEGATSPASKPAQPGALEAVCAAPDPGCRPSVESSKPAPLSRICVLSNLCAIRGYLMFAVICFFYANTEDGRNRDYQSQKPCIRPGARRLAPGAGALSKRAGRALRR